MCHRSINYVADMMEKRFGIPWFKVNFIGAEATAKSLRKIAQYFDDAELTDRVEEVIAEEMAKVETGAGRDPRALPGQDGHALRRRPPGAPLPGPVPRDRHGDGRRRLRVRPPRRLRRPPRAARRSRSTPTAATSRSCTSIPIPSAFRPRRTPRADGGAWQPAACSFSDYEGMMPEMENEHAGHRRHQPPRDRAADRDLQAGHLLRGHQGEVRRRRRWACPASSCTATTTAGRTPAFTGAANFYREIDRMVNTQDLDVHHAALGKGAATDRQPGHPSRVNGARKRRSKSWRKPAAAVTRRSGMTIDDNM